MTDTTPLPRTGAGDGPGAPDGARPARRSWPAVAAVTGATFSVTATEMLPVGLLTPMSAGLNVSEGSVGLALTLVGVTAALAAPAVPLAAGRLNRRTALVGLLGLLAAANALTAAAPSLGVLLLARVLVGVALGGVWAMAASQTVRLVPARSAGAAIAAVFSGIGLASVLAVPAGAMLAELTSWRTAFAAASGLAALVGLALALLLPSLPPQAPVRPRELTRLLGNRPLRLGLAFLALLVTGHFAAYTYVRPVLEEVSGISSGMIGLLLLGYGVAGVAGNFGAGPLAARSPRRVLLALSGGLALSTALLAAGGAVTPFAIAVLLLWGVAYGGVSVSTQTWVLAAAPDAREPAGALFASVFNACIALGAFTGGRVVDAAPLSSVLWLGAALATAALLLLAVGRERGASS
ncbi:MFS transporter [Streptomyces boncukensis]|uniref:MFS transporter n=1 Tax=Streptomyces boncukensis TaxID=2711219 RepID=A0A6G4X6J5_9ACTN|nr:MFS transporter [Streptomyces boncukensis]NGO73159.1 MFS transporter [Streptomyces boncukensis]